MKKNILFIAFLFFSVNFIYGQDDYGRVYGNIGYDYIPLTNLNSGLKKNGYDEISAHNFTLGFGGNGNIGRFIVGGEGYFLISPRVKGSNYDITTRGSLGYFYAGYQVVNIEHFYLAPLVGFGGGGKVVTIDSVVETTLDDYLINNYSKTIGTGNFIIHTALRGGIPITEHFEIAIDLGYNFGFPNEWGITRGKLTNSVTDNIGGVYTLVNFAYIMKGKKKDE